MAASGISPRFEGADFFSAEVLLEAWRLSCSTYNHGLRRKDVGNTMCLAFPGSLDGHAFGQTTTKFGVCAINANNDYFGSMIDGSARNQPPKPALVHQGALNQFLEILNKFKLHQQVDKAVQERKTILFTGHNIGGAIATLATLSILEKQGRSASVFCITFGFPLIGDEVLARAVRRHGWENHFCHVVSRGDIFSRILFAPCVSVSEPLKALMPYWQRSMQLKGDDTICSSTDISMEETCPANLDIPKLLSTILQHASAVVNYTSAANMDPTNILTETLKHFVKLSPYRPFGYYVFCSNSGAIWVENYEAILPILYYSLAAAPQDHSSILEHIGYDRVLPIMRTNVVKLKELSKLALSQATVSFSEVEIQLNGLGLGIQNIEARLALKAAGELEDQLIKNMKKLEEDREKLEIPEVSGKKGGDMTILKQYRASLERQNIGSYDSFKSHRSEEEFKANICRIKLAAFYDRVENMVETHQLPDDFQCREEWIRAGTEYRLLVEPLDICNFYRLGKHEDSGHYLRSGRPSRFNAFQKWLADKEGKDNKDSCFWGYVEEIKWLMKNNNGRDVRSKCEEFEKMMNSYDVRVKEQVVMGKSSLGEWWSQLSEQDKAIFSFSSDFNLINAQ